LQVCSQVLRFGEQKTFLGVNDVCYFVFETNFSGHNKNWGNKINMGELPTRGYGPGNSGLAKLRPANQFNTARQLPCTFFPAPHFLL